jgi:endoglucanase
MSSRIRCLALASLFALVGSTLASAAEAIRIRAGTTANHTDENGVVWLADQGFDGGDTVDRSGTAIAGTKTPSIYQAERYSMSGFSRVVANGKYTVKLHFAETYEGITGVGERVFSFNVEGHDFKGFDVTAKAGGVLRAYVETVEVEVKDGKLDISFTSQVENPEINALEIIPAG